MAKRTLLVFAFLLANLGGHRLSRPQQNDSVGTVVFRAGVVLGTGDVKPVPRQDFFLLSKSLSAIERETLEKYPLPTFGSYVDTLQISPELKAWMNRYEGSELLEAIKLHLTYEDTRKVPEFKKALELALLGYQATGKIPPSPSEKDRLRSDAKHIKKVRAFEDAVRHELESDSSLRGQVWAWLAQANPFLPSASWNGFLAEAIEDRRARARHQTPQYVVATTKTNLLGEGRFEQIKPGTYWLSNLHYAPVALARVLWDVRVELKTGEIKELELSNDNALRSCNAN